MGLAGMVGAALVVIQATGALAYNLEGGRWSGQPTSGCCATLAVQYLQPMQPYDSTGWDNGRQAWNGDNNANITWVTIASSSITVTDTYSSGVAWDGATQLLPCVSCNPYSSSHSWLNSYYTQNYSPGAIQSVTTHELGHVAGLAHASNCVIMVADTATRYYYCGVFAPQRDDENGINALY